MQIEFQNTFDDFRAAWKAHRGSAWSVKRVVASACFLLFALVIWFLGLADQWQYEPKRFLVWTPVFIVCYRVVTLGVQRYRAKDLWHKAARRQVQQGWMLSDFCVVRDVGYSRTESSWLAFHKFLETPKLFLLYAGENSYHIIPKRAFAHDAQVIEFRELLKRHIQPKTRGFPVGVATSSPTTK